MCAAVIVIVAMVGCASQPPVPKPPPKPVDAPLYRSSIDAVLGHRAELGLSDAQVQKLEDREAARAKQESDLRLTSGVNHPRAKPQPQASTPGPGQPGGSMADLPNGADAPRHAGGHQHTAAAGRAGRERAEAPAPNLQQQLDDLDTRSYVDAEQVLEPTQIEPARAVAEQYREQLYDFQQYVASQSAPK